MHDLFKRLNLLDGQDSSFLIDIIKNLNMTLSHVEYIHIYIYYSCFLCLKMGKLHTRKKWLKLQFIEEIIAHQ